MTLTDLGLNFLDQSEVTINLVHDLMQERVKALRETQRWTMAEGRGRNFFIPTPTGPTPTSPWASSNCPKPNGSPGGANESAVFYSKGFRILIPAHTPI